MATRQGGEYQPKYNITNDTIHSAGTHQLINITQKSKIVTLLKMYCLVLNVLHHHIKLKAVHCLILFPLPSFNIDT